MNYDIIIWDFNGTLIDDVQLCHNILNIMLSNHQVKNVTLKEYKDKFTFPVIDYYREVGFQVDGDHYHQLSLEFIELYQTSSLTCHLYPHTLSILKKIKEKGYLQVCLSASQIDNLKAQMHHFKIDSYFDYILGLNNIHAKSKIDVGKNWIKDYRFENKKILCIGDSLHDFEVAKALNADCVLMAHGHISKDRLLNAGCPVLDNFKELSLYLNL